MLVLIKTSVKDKIVCATSYCIIFIKIIILEEIVGISSKQLVKLKLHNIMDWF